MALKWNDKVLIWNVNELKLNNTIIAVGRMKKWIVVCTPSRIFFHGKDEMALSRRVRKAVVKPEGIYYQEHGSGRIMLLVHPLEPEKHVFFQHGYTLKEVVSGVLVLEGDGKYLLKHIRNTAYSDDCADQGNLESCEYDRSIESNQFDDDQSTEVMVIDICEDVMSSSIERYDEHHSTKGHLVSMIEYIDFLVGICMNHAMFIKPGWYCGGIKRSKHKSEVSVRFDKDITCVMKYRMCVSGFGEIMFLRMNEMLFLGNEVVCKAINSEMWPMSVLKDEDEWKQEYHMPFWSEISELEMCIVMCFPRHIQREFFEVFFECKKKIFEQLVPSGEVLDRVDRVLWRFMIKCKSVWEFMNAGVPCFEKSLALQKCKELIEYSQGCLDMARRDVMEISYKRIVECDIGLIESMNYSEVMNLAYRIIFLEKKNEERQRGIYMKNVMRMVYGMRKFFGDPRIDEVLLLFNEKPKVFEIDSDGIEGCGEKGYTIRMASSAGRAYMSYGSGMTDRRDISRHLCFPIYRNDELGTIDIKDTGWIDWPQFGYSVYRACGYVILEAEIGDYFESRIDRFVNSQESESVCTTNEFVFAGEAFGHGVCGRLKDMTVQRIMEFVMPKYAILSMAILAGVGISCMGKKDDSYGRMYLHYLRTPQPLCIHAGCIVGLGMIYAGSGNVLVRDTLVAEANRYGVFEHEQYNKGNKVWYDYAYRVLASFGIAMVSLNAETEMFRYVKLEDKLCELLANGIVLFGSKQRRFAKRLERSDICKPEEVLYSEVFSLGLMMEDEIDKVVEDIERRLADKKCVFSIHQLYRIAGKVFYVALNMLYRNECECNEEVFERLIVLCLRVEDDMKRNVEMKVVFDFCVVSLSLIANSSCNLEIIRIIRRRIKMMEKADRMYERKDFFFSSSGLKQEKQFLIRYGDIELYKLCLGIVTCGLGSCKISGTHHAVFYAISTFFINFPITTTDQEYFWMTRYFLLLSMKESLSGFKHTANYTKLCNKGSRKKEMADMSAINEMFAKQYAEASDADKKFTIDVLTDFYEVHGANGKLLSVEMLKKMACRMT
ncbi:hypothetical protein CWI40_051120 [Ordospora colligata]|nr:hypothetical protein CWI40_051120 [Ordospora colligata]